MAELGQRYLDIRSSGKGVVGRVHEFDEDGKETITRIKKSTRKHVLRKVRREYHINPSLSFNRRGITNF